MSIATLEQMLRVGERILLDTTSFIGYLDQGELISPLAAHIVNELVLPGRNPAIVSMVSVAEVLIRPLRSGAAEPYNHTLEFLTGFPNLTALPVDLYVDLYIAQEAASLRAAFRLSMADSLIVGTGIVAQVHHLVTNDVDWQRRLQPISGRIRVCLLSQHL